MLVRKRVLAVIVSVGSTVLSACILRLSGESPQKPQPTPDANGGAAGSVMLPSAAGAGGQAAVPDTNSGGTVGTVGTVGAKAGPWQNFSGNLAGLPSECGNMSLLVARPDSDVLVAGIAQQGLWSNSLASEPKWTPLGGGEGSATIKNRPSSIVFDPDRPDVFWESGTYSGGGVYKSENSGKSFIALGSLSHNDAVSVDLSDRDRRTLLAGGHEQTRMLQRSKDGGKTWENIGTRLPEAAGFTSVPLILDSRVFLLGTSHGDAAGVYRSEDAGETWTQVYAGATAGKPLRASDDSLYWLLDVDGGVIRSTDAGLTWSLSVGPKILSTYQGGAVLLELPDGRLVSLGYDTLMISRDHAQTWSKLGTRLPYVPWGVTYSAFRKTFYVWHFDCKFDGNDPVVTDAIMSLTFDYTVE